MQDAAQRGQPVVGEHLPGLSINALKERAAAASVNSTIAGSTGM